MAKINDLGLTAERIGDDTVSYDTMPEQGGRFADPLQPGTYRFKLPARMDDLWETFEHTKCRRPGKRLRAVFDESHPLLILQSPGGLRDGEPFTTRITNAERRRSKDEHGPEISDMDYLLSASFGLEKKPASNPEYAKEMASHAGQEFSAETELSWNCSNTKNIWVENGQGGTTEVEGQKGCGTTYRQRDVAKVPSVEGDPSSPHAYPVRITCTCGASVRAFSNLVRFLKAG